MRIGVISDTHGLLRLEAVAALRDTDHILHAGDVGSIEILDALRALAPVTAIRGNVDNFGPCAELPSTDFIDLAEHSFYILHSLADLDLDPSAAGISAVICGHSHKPNIEYRKGVLYFNPGSAGPRRFSLPVSLGFLEVVGSSITPRLLELPVK